MLPSLDILLAALGYGVLLPAAVAAGPVVVRRGGEVLAVGAGLAAGLTALAATGQIPWDFLRPVDSYDWLPGLALLACAVGVVERWSRSFSTVPELVRWLAPLGVGVLTGWLLVRTQAAVTPVTGWWGVVLAGAVVGFWGLDRLGRSWPGPGLLALFALVAFGAAGVVELTGFSRLAQTAGVLAAVLGGCALALRAHDAVVPGAIPTFAVLLPGLLFATYFNSSGEVPAASYLLVLAAPALLGLTAFPPTTRLSTGRLSFVRAGAVLLPLAAALAFALLA